MSHPVPTSGTSSSFSSSASPPVFALSVILCSFLSVFLLVPAATESAEPPASEQSTAPVLLKSEFIFATNEVPFASCHASTIVESRSRLLAAWFGGTGEGRADVGIWLARNEAGRWTAPVEVANGKQTDGSRYPCWNPALFQPSAGPLMLFYKVGPSPSRWWGMLMTSDDGGTTWSSSRRLPNGILGPIKDKPIELSDGAILCPSSTETNGWQVHFETTRDRGTTWEATQPLNDGHKLAAIQPTLLLHGGGKLQAVGRTRQGRIFETWSADNGKTWTELTLTSLPNPNSGIDAVTLRDGRQLLVYNHTTKSRTPLNVAVSADGKEWRQALVLENEPGEYSYPAVIQTRDGLVHITYTWNRVRIKHVVLERPSSSSSSSQ
jgi:predicted neuraminidase